MVRSEIFWSVRKLANTFQRGVWIIVGTLVILAGIFVLILRGWRNVLVWLGASLAAAGGIIIEIGLFKLGCHEQRYNAGVDHGNGKTDVSSTCC